MNTSLPRLPKFLYVFLGVILTISLGGSVSAQWVEPTQSPPGGNLPGPVWVNPNSTQNGYIDITSSNDPVVNVNGTGTTGMVGVGQDYGVVGSGTSAGVRGIGTGSASYGVFGQGPTDGYAAGFDGPVVVLPQSADLVAGNQGALYYQSSNDVNKFYFCSLAGGCTNTSDWEDLVYGAWSKNNNDIRLGKPLYTLSGPENNPFYINSDSGLQLRINQNNDFPASVFTINNGTNQSIFSLDQAGNVNFSGNIEVPIGSGITLGGVFIDSWDDLATNNSSNNNSTTTTTNTTTNNNSSNNSSNTTSGSQTGGQTSGSTSGSTSGGTSGSNTGNNNQASGGNSQNSGSTVSGVTLNGAYNWGGAGAGAAITADAGPVIITGSNGNSFEVTNSVAGKSAGVFISSSSSGVGIFGESQDGAGVGIYGHSKNGGIAGQFIAEPVSGQDIGLLATGSSAGVFQGGSLGVDATCLDNNCIALHVNNAGGGSGSVGLLVSSTNGYSAQFSGQETVFGGDVTKLNAQKIAQGGDVYIERNLEVDGEICLGNTCKSQWGSGYWSLDPAGILYPSTSSTVLVGQDSGAAINSSYPLTVDQRLLVGYSNAAGSDTGLFIDGIENGFAQVQAYNGGAVNNLNINPAGGYVTLGPPTSVDVAFNSGDVYVSGNLEVDGAICFKTVNGCKSAWPSSSGGGGSDSDWVIDTTNFYIYDYGASTGNAFNIGIGTATPTQALDVSGAIRISTTATDSLGSIRYAADDFEGYTTAGWVSLTSVGGAGQFESDGSVVYEDDFGVHIGLAAAETIANTNFASAGVSVGDLFVQDELGAAGSVYTNSDFVAGLGLSINDDDGIFDSNSSLTLTSSNDSIDVILGGGASDYFNVDSGTFIVDSQNDVVSIGGGIPSSTQSLKIAGGTNTAIRTDSSGANNAVEIVHTGSGNAVSVLTSHAESAGLVINSANYGLFSTSSASYGAYVSTLDPGYEALLVSGGGNRSATFANGLINMGGAFTENFVEGNGDLIVEDELEVDGQAYFVTGAGTPTFVDGGGDVYIGDELEVDGTTYLGDTTDRVCINGGDCTGNVINVGTDGTNGNGAYLTVGGVWTDISSRTKKDRFYTLDKQDVLQKILGLPVTGWYYIGTDENHIGPVAEDFYGLFATGGNDKALSPGDTAGVALLGIQALADKVDTLQAQVNQQQQLIDLLTQRIEALENK